ncbi:MAG: transcription antitermination factor NusB [Phycisphaerae bacterium]|nr:transcription antitermination factor NusB [Phycisphaerae bacterium]
MATPREVRRLAFQLLFQLDAGATAEAMMASAPEGEGLSPKDQMKAAELAHGAFEARAESDREISELSPQWPVHRQAAVDRAILRLAHFEIASGRTPPKVAVNEAVELAKEFSTERSPSFVNALLDKVLKRVLPGREESATDGEGPGGLAPGQA